MLREGGRVRVYAPAGLTSFCRIYCARYWLKFCRINAPSDFGFCISATLSETTNSLFHLDCLGVLRTVGSP